MKTLFVILAIICLGLTSCNNKGVRSDSDIETAEIRIRDHNEAVNNDIDALTKSRGSMSDSEYNLEMNKLRNRLIISTAKELQTEILNMISDVNYMIANCDSKKVTDELVKFQEMLYDIELYSYAVTYDKVNSQYKDLSKKYAKIAELDI